MTILSEYFYQKPETAHEIMSTKDFKELMLITQGTMSAQGKIWNIKGKSLGAGLYKVTLTKWKSGD